MQIIGYHIDRQAQTICNSNSESCSQPPYLEFLLKEHDAIRICYHLDFFTSNILTFLKFNEKTLLKLHDTTEVNVSGYKIKYVPKKFLSIIKDDKFIVLADASQYMERYDLIGDCVEKAKEACKIGVQVYNALSKLGLRPKSVISPIASFEKEILSKLDLPTIDDMPIEASEYAYKCCSGPIIQAYKRGYYEKCWDWDIRSAYASKLSECIDFRYGEWTQINHFDPTAHYGYYLGLVDMTADFHPIIYSRTNEQSSTPVGEWERHSTQDELNFITKYSLGTYEVYDGWVFHPTKIVKPYYKVLNWLNEWKEKTKGMDRKIVKRCLEGCWGYTLRVDWDGEIATPSPYFNPVFGAQTETLTKLEVAKFVIENNLQQHILSIAVDGVLVDKEVKL